jgi:UDP:flavonoid glycosyltransferase YjiC (YdhE family)
MSRPRRFLIATWDGGGNTPSAINLGARLVRAGHQARLLGWESMARRTASAGVDFRAYRSMEPWPAGLSLDEGWDRMADLLWGSATRDDILGQATEFDPDVMVVDCMLLSAFEAAEQLDRPTAVLVHVLYTPFVHGWGNGVMKADLAELFGRTDRVLALTPPGFDQDPPTLPDHTAYVGPINPPSGPPPEDGPQLPPALDEPGDPWVLLSLSTTLQGQTRALPTLLDAVGSLPVRVLLTLGDVVPVDAVHAPPNVTVAGYLPHDRVLPRMAAVIGHGGLSTITTALSYGVPMVCVPQGRDQGVNAARMEEVGVGRSVPPDSSAQTIAEAVESVLGDEGFRTVAKGFADSIAGLGGGAAATAMVEELAG